MNKFHYGGRLRGLPMGTCYECKKVFPDREDFREHMVSEHQYLRDGDMVFKRHICRWCPKPALHTFGSNHACKDHYEEIKKMRTDYVSQMRKDVDSFYDQKNKEIERTLKNWDGLKRTTKFGKGRAGNSHVVRAGGRIPS